MTTPRHGKPYVWVTWLTGLLAGEDSCVYAPWFKAHYKFDKVDRGFDLAMWKAQHAEMVNARRAELEAQGWTCTVEDQNSFKLTGETAILAGKADLVGTRGPDMVVSDEKGGKHRDSDFWQVVIYLVALPKVWKQLTGLRWYGEVVYRDGPLAVHQAQANGEAAAKIFTLMRVVGSDAPPAKVPSARECAFCDIPKSDCPERIEVETEPVLVSEF